MMRCYQEVLIKRSRVRAFVLGLIFAVSAAPTNSDAQQPPVSNPSPAFEVPEGFEVTQFADDSLAHDIYTLTFDAEGQVVVAGAGYVKRLLDTDGDGVADRADLFSEVPRQGARGMYFEGRDLICTGDDMLARIPDRDGDGRADGPPEPLAQLLQRGDHSANGVVKGPDGWYYVACGNDAGISAEHITTKTSPVTQPEQGAILRVRADAAQAEVVAHGFRNPYDLAFHARGQLLTVDADGERDQYLPWYAPTRLFDVAPGKHHGWVLPGWVRSWNRPASWFDNVERLVEIGRGSPTGSVVYQHRQFPPHYRGGMFSGCWSLGRIYYFPLAVQGDTYSGRAEVFLQPSGSEGFAPVDLEVAPDGSLFVAIGGRGTRGGVFRVRYTGETATAGPLDRGDTLQKVLAADQPLASWSRHVWVPLAQQLGHEAFEQAVLDPSRTVAERLRAVEVLTELYSGVSADVAGAVMEHGPDELTARIAWALSRRPQGAEGEALLIRMTHANDPHVQRAAWEGLSVSTIKTDELARGNWSDFTDYQHRRLRAAAILTTARLRPEQFARLWPSRPTAAERLAYLWTRHLQGSLAEDTFAEALAIFREAKNSELLKDAVRLMQIALGDVQTEPMEPDVYAGYAAQAYRNVELELRLSAVEVLASRFPSNDPELDREIARLAGMLQAWHGGLLESLASRATAESRVEEDIHYLIVLSRLPGPRSEKVSRQTAKALAELHHKMGRHGYYPSRFWPERVGETFRELCRRDPRLAGLLVEHPSFGLPEQSLFAVRMALPQRELATRKLLAAMETSDEPQWTGELVQLVSQLPSAESLPLLRTIYDGGLLRDVTIGALAQVPHAEDRSRYIEALRFGEPRVVGLAAQALQQIEAAASPEELGLAVRRLRQCSLDTASHEAARELIRLLEKWTGQQLGADQAIETPDLVFLARRWHEWYTQQYPQLNLSIGTQPEDVAGWLERFKAIDWSAGDRERGREVFVSRSCARCHAGSSRLGPDLVGLGRRLDREDRLLAVVDPNRDVSPAYWTTQIVTRTGKVHHGQIIYESPEATLVQTGPDSVLRLTESEILSTTKSATSLMPTGLLREITDQELADLEAFLSGL